MDAVASPPDLETDRPSASTIAEHVPIAMPTSNAGLGEQKSPQVDKSQHQIAQPEVHHTFSPSANAEASPMEVDQELPSVFAAEFKSTDASPGADNVSSDRELSSRGALVTSPEPAMPENSNNTAAGIAADRPGETTVSNVPVNEDAMDAVIYDVTESSTVPMPSNPNDEQLSPLHRMAEIALATSPVMSNGTINRGSDYRQDGTMVLPSQQYYQSGSSLFVPPTLSARERYEIDASRALGKTESTPVYPSSYPPSSSHSDPHPFGYRAGSPSHPAMNGKRRSSADDSAGHRYTHSRLQPKNKSPPSFRVVQLRGGVPEGAGEGVPQQQPSTVSKSDLGGNGTSPLHGAVYLDQPTSHVHEAWQGNEHASYSDRPHYPHPSYTDPIPHAQIHRYQPPESYSNVISPVMNHQNMLPPVQTQNRLSLFDLVLAAEASARENEEQQAASTSMKVESTSNGQPSPMIEGQVEASTSASSEKKSKQRKNSKKKTASDNKLPADQPTVPGSMDPPSVPSKNSKRKDKDTSSIDTGIVGHIPLRENSRSISKLLWAEPAVGKAASSADTAMDQTMLYDDDDIMPEETEPVASLGDTEMREQSHSKGKKRQSNGAIKTSTTNGKSNSAAKGKGKKQADGSVTMDGVEEEEDSQPKKKGKKNDSASKSKSKASVSQGKNRAGSLESSAAAEKKTGKNSKQKSVQIDDAPEFFEPTSSRRKGKNQAASPELIEEEEEEEDTTLYCICKKPFSEDGSTMVECDVCQNWYHINCVGVAEDDIGLLDKYVCPVCDKDPAVTLKTCYKDKCQREGCRRPGRGALSKFCSDTCGVHYALERLKANNVKPAQVVKGLSTVIQPEGIALKVSGKSIDRKYMETSSLGEDVSPKVEAELGTESSQPFQDRTVRARQANAQQSAETRRIFEQRQQKIHSALQELSRRDSFLRRVIENAESLSDLQADDAEEQADEDAVAAAEAKKSKKKKSKKSKSTAAEKAAEERPCGFDMRFLDDDGSDEVVSEQDASGQQDVTMQNGDGQEQSTVCLLPRKKCERHAGWQKLRTADLDLVRSNLTQQLEQVNRLLETCDTQASAEPILVNGNA